MRLCAMIWQAWYTLAVLLCAVLVMAQDVMGTDFAMLAALVLLMIPGSSVLSLRDALAGFSNVSTATIGSAQPHLNQSVSADCRDCRYCWPAPQPKGGYSWKTDYLTDVILHALCWSVHFNHSIVHVLQCRLRIEAKHSLRSRGRLDTTELQCFTQSSR